MSEWQSKLGDGSTLRVWHGAKGWYWHRKGANGIVMVTGGESFTRKWSAKRAALRSVKTTP